MRQQTEQLRVTGFRGLARMGLCAFLAGPALAAQQPQDEAPFDHWLPAFAAYDEYANPTGSEFAPGTPRLGQTEITIEAVQAVDDFRRWRIEPVVEKRREPEAKPRPPELMYP